MKHMNKILALALALIMVLGLATTAFAAEGDAYSITINNSAPGHTYEAYQIFKGDLSNAGESEDGSTKAVLSNVEWGSGVTYHGAGVDVTVNGTTSKSTKAADIAEALGTGALDLAAFLKDLTLTNVVAGTSGAQSDGKYVISGLEPGYYLVKDKDASLADKDDTYTSYIVEVVENSTVSPKSSKPSSQKKVKDINDSTDTTMSTWQDSADHDIGDAVPFQLKATLPSDLGSYNKYYLAFHDVQSAGLTFNPGTVKVYANGNEVADSLYTVVQDPTDDCTFEIIIQDVKAINGILAGSVITVEYTSTLNEGAVLGAEGNPNLMHIEYSNNPNQEWNGVGKPETGKTPDDKVIVFTYKVIVNKVDADKKPLAGAGFTLYKKDTKGEWVKIGDELTGEALTTFEWKGLDDGDYKLEETTTPAGYNTIAPIEFTISATHNVESDDPKLTALTGGDMFTGEVSTGALTGDVVNKAGTVLPETGGIGTTIFYILGGLLVVAAVVLLVTKKRMASFE